MPDPVLLVEDDDSLRSTVARHLRLRGHAVVEADSAEDARSALDAGLRPALVLLDLNLPGDTGWELLRTGPLAADTGPPVIIVSAIAVSHRQLAEYRVAGYLPKPFPLETLVATVERTLQPRSAKDPQ
jgi:two-component system cell cycle sensor histidine kinase/response regulator CckA